MKIYMRFRAHDERNSQIGLFTREKPFFRTEVLDRNTFYIQQTASVSLTGFEIFKQKGFVCCIV
jgi:hypothetical protein